MVHIPVIENPPGFTSWPFGAGRFKMNRHGQRCPGSVALVFFCFRRRQNHFVAGKSRYAKDGTSDSPIRKVTNMSSTFAAAQVQEESLGTSILEASIQQKVAATIDDLIAQLPVPEQLTSEQRRGIIARYAAVLEGNFIYWMTATFLAVKSQEAHPILLENLYEECRDSHPAMMRRFAIAAHAFPTDTDALAVDKNLTAMRLFLGKLEGVPSLLSMAFFEGWIQRFMAPLAKLAALQGSTEMEYTDVHGVCDVRHSQELFRGVFLEVERYPVAEGTDMFVGVNLLSTLIQNIVQC
jgi:hypothetical protein